MKRKIVIILSVLNILAFILLAVTYYSGFGFQWGDASTALTWGLPVAIISLIVLIGGIFTWVKMNWKWGAYGLGAVVIIIIYIGVLFGSFSHVLLPKQVQHENINIENKIISLVVADRLNNGNTGNSYSIVKADTEMTIDVALYANEIKERLDKQGYDFTNLIDSLIEVNQTSTRLEINSSIEDGYYIDYDGKLFNYLYKGGSDCWLIRWQWFRPQINGVTLVSRPTYDPETGYVLITLFHMGSHPSQNFGNIYAYKYVDGELVFLDSGLYLFY